MSQDRKCLGCGDLLSNYYNAGHALVRALRCPACAKKWQKESQREYQRQYQREYRKQQLEKNPKKYRTFRSKIVNKSRTKTKKLEKLWEKGQEKMFQRQPVYNAGDILRMTPEKLIKNIDNIVDGKHFYTTMPESMQNNAN